MTVKHGRLTMERLFLLLYIPLAAAMMIIMPIGGPPDEPAHLSQEWLLSTGQVRTETTVYPENLLEILQSPLFMAYHNEQPFNHNHLRPCPMLENPEKLREIVEKSGARSTDMQSPETAEHLCSKCDSYAACWAPKAEELWEARKAQKVAQVGSKQ